MRAALFCLLLSGFLRYRALSNPDTINSCGYGQPFAFGCIKPVQMSDDGDRGSTGGDETEKQVSGPVKSLPWEQEPEFIAAQEKSGAHVLMGAYRTVLKDPLPGEEYNVHLAADMLAGSIIKPGQVFSQNLQIGPYVRSKGFREGPTYIGSRLTKTIGGGVCKIASTLYNVTILSNLPVVERHPHSMPVPYVPYGQDATVAYGAKDFKFMNDTGRPILIWARGIDNILYIAFYGQTAPPEVEWHHEVLKVYKAPRIATKNPELEPGQEKIVLEGMDGAIVKSWLTIKQPDGRISVRNLGESHYSPMPYIIETGG